jgi:mRNA-degrading endonuclease RelE of RelBE toxin-antitoxin system
MEHHRNSGQVSSVVIYLINRGAEVSYRIRVGDYRVVYQVDTKKKLIIIYHVRHRKDIYRK